MILDKRIFISFLISTFFVAYLMITKNYVARNVVDAGGVLNNGLVLKNRNIQLRNFFLADLAGVIFKYSSLRGNTYYYTNLKNTKFYYSDLTDSKFVGVDLSGVSFEGSVLGYTVFKNVILNGTDFTYSIWWNEKICEVGSIDGCMQNGELLSVEGFGEAQ
jgi:uncharacterized protein YjbI with pentapeptide repeats